MNLSACVTEIETLTAEKTKLLDNIARQKNLLAGDLPAFEKETITSQIFKDEERIRKIDVLLQGAGERKQALKKELQDEDIKAVCDRLKKDQIELLRESIRRWRKVQEAISSEDKIIPLETSCAEDLAQLPAEVAQEFRFTALDHIDLRYRSFGIKSQLDGFNIGALIAALEKSLNSLEA
jgi:hypothetical protein